LKNISETITNRLIHKWNSLILTFTNVDFNRFRNKEIVILEIGVLQGGSLQMWKDYFGDKAKIFGIDIDPRCKELEEKNIKNIYWLTIRQEVFKENKKKQIPNG